MDSAQALEALLDRAEIQQLAHRYAVAVDGKDLDALAALFDDDISNGRWGKGREGIKRYFDTSLRKFTGSMHLIGTHVIDFESNDAARGIVYCLAQHKVADSDRWYDLAMTYWDQYIRKDGKWYFKKRETKWLYRQELGDAAPTIDRRLPETQGTGPSRGVHLPEAWPMFAQFWSRSPLGPAA